MPAGQPLLLQLWAHAVPYPRAAWLVRVLYWQQARQAAVAGGAAGGAAAPAAATGGAALLAGVTRSCGAAFTRDLLAALEQLLPQAAAAAAAAQHGARAMARAGSVTAALPPLEPGARRSHTPEALASTAAAAAAQSELELAAEANQASHLLGGNAAGSQLHYCAGLAAFCCGQALLDVQLLVDWAAKQLQQEQGQREHALAVLVQLLAPAVQVSGPAWPAAAPCSGARPAPAVVLCRAGQGRPRDRRRAAAEAGCCCRRCRRRSRRATCWRSGCWRRACTRPSSRGRPRSRCCGWCSSWWWRQAPA
jgi:hypothetical protein